MLKKLFLFVILSNFIIFNILIGAENITLSNWQVHTTMQNTICAATDSKNNIWIGSVGGIAIYNETNNSNNSDDLTNISPILLNTGNKLLSSTITALINVSVEDFSGTKEYMITGSSDGIIEIIDVNSLDCEHITSIKTSGFANSAINSFHLLSDGKRLLIAGNFGIVEFNISDRTFIQAALTLGDFSRNTAVNNILTINDTIYVSTPVGIAWISADKSLRNHTNWQTLTYGTVTYEDAEIINHKGVIYANLSTGIYKLTENSFKLYTEPNTYRTFKKISVFNDKLLLTDNYSINIIDDVNQPEKKSIVFSGSIQNQGITILNNPNISTKIVCFYETFGCEFIKEDFSSVTKTPNTPFSSYFTGMKLDNTGTLYCVSNNSQLTGSSGPFMSFDGTKWTNYHNKLDTNLPSFIANSYLTSINISNNDNKVYISSWGSGVWIKDAANKLTYLDTTNSELEGYVTNSSYVVCGQTDFDNNGNIWITNYGTGAGNMLVRRDSLGNSQGFVCPFNGGIRYVFNIAIDENNTKWIAGHKDGNQGLYYFNENNTIENTADDIWGNLNTINHPELLANYFYTCVYDKYTNTIWLGNNRGLSIINNPNAALTNSNFIIIKNKLLDGKHINDIFIDGIGNKWIATNNGIWVISADGLDSLAHFTTNNTPLFNNEVQAITINPNNGLVYIGTSNGLFIAQGNILLPQNNYNIKTYPQPFNTKKHKELIIDGLTTESDIRIVTADGVLIRRLNTSSKRTVWDGKDNDGNLVSAGIYLILSNSQISNSGDAAKIVVVDY